MNNEFYKFLIREQSEYDTIFIKKTYIDMTGGLVSGALLSQIIYWHLPDKNGNPTKLRIEKNGYFWLAKAHKEWWDEIRITEKQVKRALTTLKNKEIIKTQVFRFNGLRTNHIRINENVFIELHEKSLQESSKSTKGPFRSVPFVLTERDKRDRLITETTTEITTDVSTPPEGELTPPAEEKTPLRVKNDKISNLPKKQRNAQNEWFMVPDKLEFEFHDPEHIKLLNRPDKELVVILPAYMEDDSKRETLETDIELFFRFARQEKVCEPLINKIKNIAYILDKFDYKQYLKGFELAQEKGKENKLSYLRKVLERAFMPKVYSQQMKLKL